MQVNNAKTGWHRAVILDAASLGESSGGHDHWGLEVQISGTNEVLTREVYDTKNARFREKKLGTFKALGFDMDAPWEPQLDGLIGREIQVLVVPDQDDKEILRITRMKAVTTEAVKTKTVTPFHKHKSAATDTGFDEREADEEALLNELNDA